MSLIQLPLRPSKPRCSGLTQMLDPGLDLQRFEAIVTSHAAWIDIIKFGWGSALITRSISDKIALCRQFQIEPILGGSLFEYCILTDQLRPFQALLDSLELTSVEVSNGTGRIEHAQILDCIRAWAQERCVYHEVGSKDQALAEAMTAEQWRYQVEAGRDAGAVMTILEARESGQSGYCNQDGEVRYDLCEQLLTSFGADRLIFEAPNRSLQVSLIDRIGPEVNLANIHSDQIVGLETLRLGLRYDTLARFPIQNDAFSLSIPLQA